MVPFQLDPGADVAAARANPATVVALVDFTFRLRVIGEAAFPRWRAAQLQPATSANSLCVGAVVHYDLQCLVDPTKFAMHSSAPLVAVGRGGHLSCVDRYEGLTLVFLLL